MWGATREESSGMPEQEEGKAGALPKELIGVDCPRCGFKISQDTEVEFHREDSYFVGFTLICPECSNNFGYTLY